MFTVQWQRLRRAGAEARVEVTSRELMSKGELPEWKMLHMASHGYVFSRHGFDFMRQIIVAVQVIVNIKDVHQLGTTDQRWSCWLVTFGWLAPIWAALHFAKAVYLTQTIFVGVKLSMYIYIIHRFYVFLVIYIYMCLLHRMILNIPYVFMCFISVCCHKPLGLLDVHHWWSHCVCFGKFYLFAAKEVFYWKQEIRNVASQVLKSQNKLKLFSPVVLCP